MALNVWFISLEVFNAFLFCFLKLNPYSLICCNLHFCQIIVQTTLQKHYKDTCLLLGLMVWMCQAALLPFPQPRLQPCNQTSPLLPSPWQPNAITVPAICKCLQLVSCSPIELLRPSLKGIVCIKAGRHGVHVHVEIMMVDVIKLTGS